MKKRGSLNLSIEVIIIVVIAFVVLGLGLGFVRSQFSQVEETSTQVQQQIEQQILDDLRRGNQKLNFPTDQLTLETGADTVQAIGVKNTRDEAQTLSVGFQVRTDQGFSEFSSEQTSEFVTSGGVDFSARITWDDSQQNYASNEARVIPVTITAPDKTGTYLYKVLVYNEAGEIYDERTFFIKTS